MPPNKEKRDVALHSAVPTILAFFMVHGENGRRGRTILKVEINCMNDYANSMH
jgi:hypothetical protein